MNFGGCIFCISWVLIINLNFKLNVDGLELYAPGEEQVSIRALCPENQNIECATDEDCVNKISEGSLHKNCAKCVCWRVPVCDVKRRELSFTRTI